MTMDRWKYFDITHRYHVLCNPTSAEKLQHLMGLLNLAPKARVVDIGSGKGEMLVRLAEMYDIKGAGVDLSPYAIADAEKKRDERVPNAEIEFVNLDGADYSPPEPQDLAMCIGASHRPA